MRAIDSEHDDAERAARRARSELDSAASDRDRIASELSQVRSALASTPELIEVPIEGGVSLLREVFPAHRTRRRRAAHGRKRARHSAGRAAHLGRLPQRRLPARRASRAWGPDLYIAPHPPRFPVDEELIDRALAGLSKETVKQLSRALTGHGARFLRAAAAMVAMRASTPR